MNTAAFTAYREKVVSNCARVIVGKDAGQCGWVT